MKKCPICKTEFDDAEKNCPKCAAEQKNINENSDVNWKVLTTVANDIEFEMVARLLEGAGIPAVRKVNGIDGYLTLIIGIPLGGVDVLVPEDMLKEAEQLLDAKVEFEEPLDKEP